MVQYNDNCEQKNEMMCKETVVVHLVSYSTIYLEGMRKDTNL